MKVLCQELPSKFDCIVLEVVTETEVAQHFEEGVVTSGIANIIQVVVFTACADTLLSGRCTGVRTLVKAQEHVLKLIHTCIGKQQCRVIARHHRAGMHNRMTFAFVELQKGLANLRSLHNQSLFIKNGFPKLFSNLRSEFANFSHFYTSWGQYR